MKRLEGKIAIVTGSTSGIGIGIGIAEAFAKEGAHVVVCGRREGRRLWMPSMRQAEAPASTAWT